VEKNAANRDDFFREGELYTSWFKNMRKFGIRGYEAIDRGPDHPRGGYPPRFDQKERPDVKPSRLMEALVTSADGICMAPVADNAFKEPPTRLASLPSLRPPV
jgi:hypothetical protein